ncbi:MAG: DUF456 domain-containing protein [Phycisphaerales bacterium]|nr:DUF456 domain-containing protein [Planctomycetota bacterium]
MLWLVVTSLLIAAALGLVLSILTLPGIWLPVAVAIGFQIYDPSLFPWWSIVVAALIGLLAEGLELAASAMGASKAGGTKRAAAGAIAGTIFGAVCGSFVLLFPIGTIVGAVVGAGLGAGLLDSSRNERTLKQVATVGAGAAAARGVAIVLKGLFGIVLAGVLIMGLLTHHW